MEENELELLKKCKTITECAKIIKGIDYTNGRIKQEIIDYCFENYEIDIIEMIGNNRKNFCLECGARIPARKKFCNSSCAAKYNNRRRTLSEEKKRKISESVRKHWELFPENRADVIKGWHKENYLERHTFTCKNCGKIFFSKNLHAKFCCPKCARDNEDTKVKIRTKVNERIKNGTFSGWKSRNIRSYPETFWEGVLKNNNITFIPEDFSTKKYFLDFLIEKNGNKIDLEIDGKQHKERKEHDIERDKFLTENGFIVYRIKWNGRQKLTIF